MNYYTALALYYIVTSFFLVLLLGLPFFLVWMFGNNWYLLTLIFLFLFDGPKRPELAESISPQKITEAVINEIKRSPTKYRELMNR